MGSYLQGRGIHVDRHLSNVAIAYQPVGFVGEEVAPIVPVQNRSDMMLVWNQADLFRRDNSNRSPGTEAKKVYFSANSASYICDNYALKTSTNIEDRVNADPIFTNAIEEGRVMFLKNKLMLDMDLRVSSLCFNTTNVGSTVTVTSGWNSYTNANPMVDIWTAIDNIQYGTGYRPNSILFGTRAWENFRRNNNVINKAKSTAIAGGGPTATIQDVQNLFEFDRVVVGRAFYNTTGEGLSQSISPIWGDTVLVYYAPPTPSMTLPSFMYSFRWQAPGIANMQVERHPYDPKIKSDEIELGYYQDEVVTASALGNLLVAVSSSH